MSKFEDIKELLATAFDKFSDVLQIEMRSEFSVIDLKDYGGQSFIISNIQFDDNTGYRFSQYKSTLEFVAAIIEDNQDKFILIAGDFNSDLVRRR